ncbi:DNA helicase-2/ATP-dependent DNA helicase PcrA [Tumebacillus sp. BK434]|uniref:RNA polymerase recycling motor HelD n=1 Tax=Tumebacillus sp. BK434 TaxID=2512169 RepID=UPI00104FD70A|nr:RNA polymerase recycling motor HelD [Tumebacillus sp. BK434]TCP57957.1 DNA helicase-2/ATP-dependent DNA helicase PcrA [Tumebacillus sp. BK434]
MTIKLHRDYGQECTRLADTKGYIEYVLHESEHNEKAFRENIKEAYANLNSLDGSEGYIALLTNVQFFEMTRSNIRQLQQVQQKPYFCRIDIKPDDTERVQPLYIGKASLFRPDTQEPVIVDWRSPVANVYYEGRIGAVTYETATGTEQAELHLKRQYTIEDGTLHDFRDIDITTRDELLQESLGGSADSRLKDIVSTIQEEQNRVIRADMHRPMIVQGAAGSGKTTIALHRIAYLIYTYGDRFNPDQFMILAPHQLFLKYIADVLPELGVEAVRQTTYLDFVQENIGKKLKLTDPNERLFRFLEGGGDADLLRFVSRFKGSAVYKQLIDTYLADVVLRTKPERDCKLGKRVIAGAEEVAKFIREDYAHMPLYKRVEKVRKILQDRLKVKKKQLLKDIHDHYDERLEVALSLQDPARRKAKVVKLMDDREKLLKRVEADAKTLVKEYMAQFGKMDLAAHYREFLQRDDLLSTEMSEAELRYLQEHSLGLLGKKRMELEDTAALLYLQHQLYGLLTEMKVRNLVIDEAQDYSIFQLLALKAVLGSEMFTILGDLSQGIHSYRGVESWEAVLQTVFPGGNCQYLVLEQSYRTTVEIMNLANRVIVHSQTPGLVLAKPVVRHGDEPRQAVFAEQQELVAELLADVAHLKADGMNSIAVIGKTMAECKQIKKWIDALGTELSVTVLDEKEDYSGHDLVIVPSYVVKGLEFDAVFIVSLDEEYTTAELDVKLLYVAMTRPLHRMFVYSMAGKTQLLDLL